MQNENAILSAQTITQSHKAFGINIQSKALHIEERNGNIYCAK